MGGHCRRRHPLARTHREGCHRLVGIGVGIGIPSRRPIHVGATDSDAEPVGTHGTGGRTHVRVVADGDQTIDDGGVGAGGYVDNGAGGLVEWSRTFATKTLALVIIVPKQASKSAAY